MGKGTALVRAVGCVVLSLLEQLAVIQPVKNFEAFILGNSKCHYWVHNIAPLRPILVHLNPFCTLISCILKIPLNIISTCTFSSPDWSLPGRVLNENFVCTSYFPMSTASANFIVLDLIALSVLRQNILFRKFINYIIFSSLKSLHVSQFHTFISEFCFLSLLSIFSFRKVIPDFTE